MFDIRFYFARRGSENFKQMTINTFKVVHDELNQIIYVRKVEDELQKNHKEIDNEIITGYMPEIDGDPLCPVESFREYISHLNPNCESLWQTPIDNPKTSVWYANSTVGDHPISEFMKCLSDKGKLSRVYTNHDIRVTGCTILGRCNFSDLQIMSVSSHKSRESLKIYKKVSLDEKFMMGYTLDYALKHPNQIPEVKDKKVKGNDEPPAKKIKAIMPKDIPTSTKTSECLQEQKPSAPIILPQETLDAEKALVPVQKLQNIVDIPGEYDVDMMELLADIQNYDMQIPSNVPGENNQVNAVSNTNTQINFHCNPDIPSFNNCQIGTINFNIIKK